MFKKILVILIAVVVALGLSKLSFAMMCGEHSGHKKIAQAETGTQTQTEEGMEAEPKEAVNVGNKICPVSGEKINEKMKSTYEYEGKIYNFCCAMCIDEFKKDPQKYIQKVEEELQTESAEEAKHEENEMGMMHEGHQH